MDVEAIKEVYLYNLIQVLSYNTSEVRSCAQFTSLG
jgi:hypothetical protein